MDQHSFRNAMSAFVTGVVVVTTKDGNGELLGITANSFNSVSLDPPLILVSVARSLRSFQAFSEASCFAINILSHSQQEVCMRFAKQGSDKWSSIEHEVANTGSPLIPGRLGHFDCKTWARYDGGDHLILVGEVVHFTATEKDPLVYYRGSFPELTTRKVLENANA